MSERPFALRASGVTKSYGGVRALAGVDVHVRAGEVLCLAGANGSGKSTLIKIISGVENPDHGTIELGGTSAQRLTVKEAVDRGVQVIFQDMSLFPNLTVAENIAMSARVSSNARWISERKERALARSVVERLGLRLDLDAEVQDLPVADRQLVAICRALALDVKVLFMDEPTTALTWHEVETLFRVVAQLKEQGVAIVFVSHKTDEVLDISDRITVLRNGEVVADGPTAEFDHASLVEALLGYSATEDRVLSQALAAAAPALEVEGLAATDLFADVSFSLVQGEVVGLTGLLGSGRSEVAEAIFGKVPTTGGRVRVAGREVSIEGIDDALRAGVAYVPSDRLTQGVFLDQSIATNLVSATIGTVTRRGGVLDESAMAAQVDDAVRDLAIKIGEPTDPARSLSGGNQQKVVLGKWLATDPGVLILNGPTVGVDAGSKAAIMEILRRKASAGMAILLISDDVPELVSICHRVLFIRRGRMSGELAGDEITESNVRERLVT
ncbi:sugar ABC transporter ATP-binding protein [Actinotalea sp. K2]|uniref:sugar ABC transporter ATP-binding protein n=1 Tax=Actinotalea sp. K2 TaxID=2939438 RepID=UPI002016B24D|nr:sugar ABC transporter ATP-binding protein [Actinotalea sp. K2]MCL3862080.1 sugar ABC transporter ATP-binding protein [Actinotalea sp. K2]